MTKINLTDDLEKFSYALGLSISANLIQSGVKSIHPDAFISALKDVFSGERPQINPEEANQIIEAFVATAQEGDGAKNLEEGLAFLAENKKKSGIVELPSGLQYEVLKEGEGEIPTASDQVRCHYHGTLIDGTVFDRLSTTKSAGRFSGWWSHSRLGRSLTAYVGRFEMEIIHSFRSGLRTKRSGRCDRSKLCFDF